VLIDPRPLNHALLERYAITPAEQRVLSVLVRGASNREIARHLTLSLKTVESHLTAVNCKAGTTARGEVIVLFATRAMAPVEHYVAPGDDVSAGCF